MNLIVWKNFWIFKKYFSNFYAVIYNAEILLPHCDVDFHVLTTSHFLSNFM